MKIEQNKVVSLTYDLRKESHEGEMIESVNTDRPLQFIFGMGMMLQKFESNLQGMEEGADFQFELKPEESYGEYSADNVFELPKQNFEIDGKIEDGILEVGNLIPLQDQQGNQFEGLVTEVKEETVIMDFNHPMAGKSLFFTGKVVGVREATAEELDHGHVHDGHQH
ncbi:MAG: peptidylprolyl isomerase [Bacteroidales bacterium]|nr:peptidylprolyl isomerase [Bacteroidales bacterium]